MRIVYVFSFVLTYLCLGVGIGFVQDGPASGPDRDFYYHAGAIAGIGTPYVLGMISAIGSLAVYFLRAQVLGCEDVAVSTCLALLAGVIWTITLGRLGQSYSLLAPGIILIGGSLALAGYFGRRPLPKVLRFPVIVVWCSTIGMGAGNWQMGFTRVSHGILRPDRLFAAAGSMVGGVFSSVAGPILYFLVLRGRVSIHSVCLIVGTSLTAGWLAAPFFGAGAYVITIVTSIAVMGAVKASNVDLARQNVPRTSVQ